jgi:hypothetical protein
VIWGIRFIAGLVIWVGDMGNALCKTAKPQNPQTRTAAQNALSQSRKKEKRKKVVLARGNAMNALMNAPTQQHTTTHNNTQHITTQTHTPPRAHYAWLRIQTFHFADLP